MKIRVVVRKQEGPVATIFSVETEGNKSDLAYIEAKMKELSGKDVVALVSPAFMINHVAYPEDLVAYVREGIK